MVFPAKYRKKIFDDEVDKTLKDVCLEISERYEIHFLEIGNDVDSSAECANTHRDKNCHNNQKYYSKRNICKA